MPDQLDIELRAKLAEDSLRKVRAQFASLQADAGKTLGKLQVGVDASGLKSARSALGQIRNDADQFTKSMAAANARVLAFGTAVSVIEGMRRSFLALIKTTVDVEKALTQISVIAGDDLKKSGISIEQFGKQIFQVAKDVGQGFDTTQKAALEFSRQGLGVQESLKRTRDALILTRVSGIDYKTAVDGLTSTLNSFRQAGLDSTTVINKLVAVDNAAAVSLIDLVEGLQRTASVSQLTGQDIDQTIASIATLQEITARGGAQIGNSLKSIFTRIYDEDSLKYLDKLQVGVRDSSNQILPAIQIIENLSKVINDLPKEQQLSILKDLSGLYQVNAAAALTGQAFKELNGQRSIYQRILDTSTGATKEATEANKKLSATLASQFNVLDVQIGELLNKFGELGVKNPLGGVLDFLIRIQNTMQGILQGSGPLDQLIQGLVSFSGGALFSAPVLAGGAFVLVKIIKDFLKFASTAFQVFTGINRKLGEQESVQGSISAKIKESATSLNSVISGEQKRLSLTKATTAEYSKQLALAGATASSLKSKNNAQQFIFGEERVIKPKKGQLDSYNASFFGNQKSSDIPETRVSPKANSVQIQGSLKNRSGQFIGQKPLNDAIVLMTQQWLAAGIKGKELSAAINKTVGTFEFNRESFLKASKAANTYVNGLIKDRETLSKNPPKPAFTQGARGLPAPSGLQGQVDPAIAKALSFQRSANPPRIASDLFNVDAGRAFAEKLNQRERPRLTPLPPARKTIAVDPILDEESRSEGLKNLAFKSILVASAMEGIISAFKGTSEESQKLAESASKASYALIGISALNQLGGVNLGSLLGGKGGGLSKLSSGLGPTIGKILTPLLAFGKTALRFVPIIGQVVLGLTLFNEAIKAVTGTSIYEKIRIAFGGLTESTENVKKSFDELSVGIFSDGNYKGKSQKDVLEVASRNLFNARSSIEAKNAGLSPTGQGEEDKNAVFKKNLRAALGEQRTGGRNFQSVANLPKDIQEFIYNTVGVVADSTIEDLKRIIKENGGEKIDTNKLPTDELRITAAKLAYQKVLKERGFQTKGSLDFDKKGAPINTSNFTEYDRAGITASIDSIVRSSIPNAAGIKTSGVNAPALSPESQKLILEFQRDIQFSLLDNAANSIDAQLKNLDIRSQDASLTQNAQRAIEDARLSLQKQALDISTERENVKGGFGAKIIQTELAGQKKTVDEAAFELNKLGLEVNNSRDAIKDQINSLDKQKSLIDLANIALDNFSRATNAAQSALSTISVTRARSNQEVSRLESAANDPTANVFAREGFQRQANQERIKDLQTSGFDQIRKQAEIARTEAKKLPEDQKFQKFNEINKLSQEQTIALQTQIQELESANQNIGAFSSASVELTNSLEEFRRSIAQSKAQNEINLLQSTDSSGIAGGLISKQVFGAAEGKSGEELVSFLADQNFLLNEQFKIRTASNAAEKLELETQLELSRELLDIKTQSLDPAEKQRQIEEAINKNLEKRRSFGFGVSQAQSNIQSEIQTFGSDFGKTATEGFRDGLVSAMQAAVSQTDNLKESLLDVALVFANKLRDAALTNLANVITNSFIPKKDGSGGVVSSLVGAVGSYFTGGAKKYASGGSITGGSGVKDDVPTLLMGGEYVIPKSTVQEYGKGFFDSLRNGSVGKMAQGGYFAPGVRGQGTISGKENLLDFATQTATSGNGDYISQLSGNAAVASLEPESLRLSNFNRFGDSPIVQATQDTKEQAFGLYLDQLNSEKEYQAQLREQELQAREQEAAIAKAKKDKKKQFLISLALAAVGAGVSYGAGKVGTSTPKALSADAPAAYNANTGLYETVKAYQTKPVGGNIFSSAIRGIAGAFKATAYGNADIDATTARDQELANSGNPAYKGFSQTVGASGRTLVPGYSVASNHYALGTKLRINGQLYSVDDRGGMSKNVIDFYSGSDRALYNKHANMGRINPQVYRNSGGYVGGNGDNVPAMLSNKEYVLNSSAAKKLGDKNLYALNNGQSQSSGDSSDKIISKLDELIEKTIGASNVTVTVSMDSSGKEKSSESSGDDQQQNNNQRNLSQKIKETVVNVIREEQRPGGILSRR